MGELWAGYLIQGPGGGGNEAVDHLRRGALARGQLGPDISRVHRAGRTGELVVGDQHPAHPGQPLRQVEVPLAVQDLGLHPGHHLEPGHRPQRGHRGGVVRHPW